MYMIINILMFSVVKGINFDILLDQYVLTCGYNLCSESYQDLENLRQYTSLYCSKCSCNKDCIFHGNCCPDVYFSLNVTCYNTTMLSTYTKGLTTEDFFLMKTSCPANTDTNLKGKCEGPRTFSEKIQSLPVTSNSSYFTYSNKYCALCHNETNVAPWSISISCDKSKLLDFNLISTYDELFDDAIKNKCTLGSFINNSHVKGCHNVYGKNIIKSCNVSGSWMSYDHDVEWACANYDNVYHVFRNVFCYICNPPVKLNKSISYCNITGKWAHYDFKLEKACVSLGETLTTYPFKNIFCYYCNTDDYVANETTFYDAIANITLDVSNGKYFKYTFNIESISTSVLIDDILNGPLNDTNFYKNTINVSLANIYIQYYALTGTGHFCQNISDIVEATDVCSCEDNCIFNITHPCCIDKAFQYSTTCLDIGSYDKYLVYDGCENVANNAISLIPKCQSWNNTDNLLEIIPVKDTTTNENYLNIYCGLCRYNRQDSRTYASKLSLSVETLKLWKFDLSCNSYIPLHFHIYLLEIFSKIEFMGCHITLRPDVCDKQCHIVSDSCADTNYDIDWACKNYQALPVNNNYYYKLDASLLTKYSNVFCAMCKSANEREIINYCNSTGMWNKYDKNIEEKCLQLPHVTYHWPYKNIFCKICNEAHMDYTNNYLYHSSCLENSGGRGNSNLRNLFVLPFIDDHSPGKSNGNCESNKVYDSVKEICRDIVCYPGRMLINKTCLPLLPTTSNLGYILAFGIEVTSFTVIFSPSEFLSNLNRELSLYLATYLELNKPFIEYSVLKANKTCTPNETWFDDVVGVSVFMRIFVSETVDRNSFEMKLVRLQTEEVVFQYRDASCDILDACDVNCIFIYDEEALEIPILIQLQSMSNVCFDIREQFIHNADYYTHSPTSKLLQCPQIELGVTEWSFRPRKSSIEIIAFNEVLGYNDFYVTKTNESRICVDKFQELLSSKTSNTTIETILMICTITSLLALLLTFITYCLFSPLRTLPGKNNMSLVVAMFFAMAFIEFGIKQTLHSTTCSLFGALIHYFWLCTFTCLNVCSFHMFITFRRVSIHYNNSKDNKRLLCYILYSFGGPALIVFLTIIVTYSVTSTGSYGYGGLICFISERIAHIVGFITPVVIICLINVFFFISTACSIASTPKVESSDAFKRNQVQFAVYIKLFMITGSSWIFQVIDSFLPLTAFSVIVSVLNSFQGVYIFIAYMTNKRVLDLYKNLAHRVIPSLQKENLELRTGSSNFTSTSINRHPTSNDDGLTTKL